MLDSGTEVGAPDNGGSVFVFANIDSLGSQLCFQKSTNLARICVSSAGDGEGPVDSVSPSPLPLPLLML